MSNHKAVSAINRAKEAIAALIEQPEPVSKGEINDVLFSIQSLLYSVSDALNSTEEPSVDFADAVSGAMLNINKLNIVASRYSDAVFSDADSENADYLILRTLIDFAYEAKRRLKIAESELFK